MPPLRQLTTYVAAVALLGHLEADNQPLSALTRPIGVKRNTFEVYIECAIVVVIILQASRIYH